MWSLSSGRKTLVHPASGCLSSLLPSKPQTRPFAILLRLWWEPAGLPILGPRTLAA